MNGPTMDTVLQRLDQVERENRHLKRVGSAVLVGIAALLLMGQVVESGRTVEAEQFILKDASGRRRAELGLRDGSAGLYFHGEKGTVRAKIELDQQGRPDLRFFDQKGIDRASFFVGDDHAHLFISDSHGDTVMLNTGGGHPELSLATGNVLDATLRVGEKGSVLWLRDRAGEGNIFLQSEGGPLSLDLLHGTKGGVRVVAGEKGPSLVLFGEKGIGGVDMSVLDNLAALRLSDENKEIRAVLGHTTLDVKRLGTVHRPVSSLVLFDKDGKVLWSAPWITRRPFPAC